MDEELKDMCGMPLGRVHTDNRGRKTLYGMCGFVEGHYDPQTKQTTDRSGMPVGQGNLLTSLLANQFDLHRKW